MEKIEIVGQRVVMILKEDLEKWNLENPGVTTGWE